MEQTASIQIYRMVEEKNEILSEKMKDEYEQQRMESMLKLLEDEPDGCFLCDFVHDRLTLMM